LLDDVVALQKTKETLFLMRRIFMVARLRLQKPIQAPSSAK